MKLPRVFTVALLLTVVGAGCQPAPSPVIPPPEQPTVSPAELEKAEQKADEMEVKKTEIEGAFKGAVHAAQGSARIVRSDTDGWAVILSDDFKTDAGPDLHVIVTSHPDPKTSADVHTDSYRDLGSLVKNEGGQAYEIGLMNLENIKSIVIYCKPFKVVFAVAPLK